MERGPRSPARTTASTEPLVARAPWRRRAPGFARSAFTLMEVLVVLALMGLVAGIALIDFDSMLEGASKHSPLETLTAAVDAGRARALNAGAPVRLTYDAESGVLRLNAGGAPEIFAFEKPAQVTFALPPDEAEGAERALDAITFHPAGVAMPAVIDLSVGGERSRYRLEPFSAALAKEETR